jgi:CDP-diacylglycerol---glycerol-3-phosphate 3-phosphatidyltransferase
MSIYRLKPAFQSLLRPLVRRMFSWGITANAVTLTACLVSVALGLALFFNPPAHRWLYLLVPAWLLLRMALNAIDGMLAREFGQKSRLGAYLNELTDVVSDAALYLPFASLLPHGGFWVGLVILLSALGELAGVLGQTVGASRRYDGPMGKSDRALVFGLLGVWVAMSTTLPSWSVWVMPLVALLTACTTINRVRHGLRESSSPSP